jgi:hypothetical protein
MTKPDSLPKKDNKDNHGPRAETAQRSSEIAMPAAGAEPGAADDTPSPSGTQAMEKPRKDCAKQRPTARVPASTKPGKEELIAMVREMTERNGGRIPTRGEFHQITGIHWRLPRRLFGSYRAMLEAAGCKARGPGWELNMAQLFADWAEVVRKAGRIPTQEDYGKHSRYSVRPFASRFGSWYSVPHKMLEFARATNIGSEWEDVLKMVEAYVETHPAWSIRTSELARARTLEPGLTRGRPVYGRPILTPALATAPTNENGVLFLFGALAERLGFMVLRLQSEYPDCEALRRMEGERWQRVRIEFEFESKNFLAHEHDERHCDLIVCWRDNWPGCPLEVVELEKVIG